MAERVQVRDHAPLEAVSQAELAGRLDEPVTCVGVPFDELSEADQQQLLDVLLIPPDSVHKWSEAPGVEWPTD